MSKQRSNGGIKISGQYRSSLKTVFDIMESLKLSTKHKKLIRDSCPFWDLCHLILSNGINKEMCMKSDIDLANIIANFDNESRSFKLGGASISITKQDFENIFGICGGETEITIKDKDVSTKKARIDKNVGTKKEKNMSEFYKRRFLNISCLCKTNLSDLLSDAVGGDSENDMEDVPRLLTLLLLAAFFIPSKCWTLDKRYIDYVDDLSNIKSFDWSSHIFERFFLSLCKESDPTKVNGCVMALPYWLMENFNIGMPLDEKARPLCKKWNLKDLTVSTKKATIAKVCQVKGRRIKDYRKNLSDKDKDHDIGRGEKLSESEEENQSIGNEGESNELHMGGREIEVWGEEKEGTTNADDSTSMVANWQLKEMMNRIKKLEGEIKKKNASNERKKLERFRLVHSEDEDEEYNKKKSKLPHFSPMKTRNSRRTNPPLTIVKPFHKKTSNIPTKKRKASRKEVDPEVVRSPKRKKSNMVKFCWGVDPRSPVKASRKEVDPEVVRSPKRKKGNMVKFCWGVDPSSPVNSGSSMQMCKRKRKSDCRRSKGSQSKESVMNLDYGQKRRIMIRKRKSSRHQVLSIFRNHVS